MTRERHDADPATAETPLRDESAYEGRTDNPPADTDAGRSRPATGSGPSGSVQPDVDVVRGESAREGGGAARERDSGGFS
jgi:hypothetical protein